MPIALKDILCTKGEETTAGSRILEGHVPIYDGGCVSRVKGAGLISLGKTNMDEFAMGSSTENSAFGVTRNPWDPERVPGGSSGGSAAAVAAGFAPLALGTDTGGSIRQPAALCGVVGMKPTYGAVSRYGLIAFASSLDQIGPFALTVRDCALLLEVICGNDALRLDVGRAPGADRASPTRRTCAGCGSACRPTCSRRASSRACARRSTPACAPPRAWAPRSSRSSLPHAGYALPAYYLIAPAEASRNLGRFDGVRYGLRLEEDGDTVVDMYGRTRAAGFGAEVKRRIMLGTYALSAGYYDAYYGKAQKVRTRIRDDFDAAFAACDLIATPTSPTVAFRIGERVDDPLAMYVSDVLTVPVEPGGPAGDLAPLRPLRGPAGGLPAGRPGVRREPDPGRRACAGAGAGLRSAPAGRRGGAGMSGNDRWEPVIGLEIHVQLDTDSKMFCRCENRFGDEPNTRTCPVCLGPSGRAPDDQRRGGRDGDADRARAQLRRRRPLPVPPQELLLSRQPKAYQISQYDQPICVDGHLDVDGDRIGITRAHLEEDAAKLVHAGGAGGRIAGASRRWSTSTAAACRSSRS